jgi:hypothetical protein
VARLARLAESARSGAEFTEAALGRYDLERIETLGDDMATLDLRPVELREFIRTNGDALLAEAGLAD